MNAEEDHGSDAFGDALDIWLIAYEEWRSQRQGHESFSPDTVPSELRDELFDIARCIDVLDRTLRGKHPQSRHPRAERVPADRDAPEPRQLGKFEIVRELGRGGFSVVYLALDTVMRRRVALKVPLPDILLTSPLRTRWLREAQSAAGLNHPNIVRAYEAGRIGPICYIASEYCDGPTLADWLRSRGTVPVQTAARLVTELASAAEQAHRNGILHRDIKPGNVMLVPRTGGGDPAEDNIIPRLTDFGLAKLLDEAESSDASRTGWVIGTPAYMAPEQALGKPGDVRAATDVYALGAVLYELLTGQPPVARGSDAGRSAGWTEPVSPRQRRANVPAELAQITLKCLAYSPDDRYPSAQALCDDLQRFLRHEPISAGRSSRWTRVWKAIHRRPARSALVGAAVLLLIGSSVAVMSVTNARQAQWEALARAGVLQSERDLAVAQVSQTDRRIQYAAHIEMAQRAWIEGRTAPAMADLEAARALAAAPAGFEVRWLQSVLHREQTSFPVQRTAIQTLVGSPDGSLLAFAGPGTTIRLWDVAAKCEAAPIATPPLQNVVTLAFSRDGRSLAAAGSSAGDRDARPFRIVVWTITARDAVFELENAEPILGLAISPDARILAFGSKSRLTMWSLAERRLIADRQITAGVRSLAFSPNGQWLAAGSEATGDDAVSLWDTRTAEMKRSLPAAGAGCVRSVAFSPLGNLLAAGCDDRTVRLWETESGAGRGTLKPHHGSVGSLAFISNDTLVSAERDYSGADLPGTLTIWDVDTRCPRSFLVGHKLPVTGLTRLDETTVATGSYDGTIKIWTLTSREPQFDLRGHESEVWAASFDPRGDILATAGDDNTIKLWDLDKHTELRTLAGHDAMVSAVAFSRDGKFLATGSYDGTARIWDLKSGSVLVILKGHTAPIRCLDVSPDGRTIATGGKDNTVRLWDSASGSEVRVLAGHFDHVRSVAFTPAGDTLLSASLDFTVRAHDTAVGETQFVFKHDESVLSLAVSPAGDTLATGGSAGAVCIWDLQNRSPRYKFTVGSDAITSLSFAPDGNSLACGCRDGLVYLVDPVTSHTLLTFQHSHQCNAVAFSRDGKHLAAVFHDGGVRVWSTRE